MLSRPAVRQDQGGRDARRGLSTRASRRTPASSTTPRAGASWPSACWATATGPTSTTGPSMPAAYNDRAEIRQMRALRAGPDHLLDLFAARRQHPHLLADRRGRLGLLQRHPVHPGHPARDGRPAHRSLHPAGLAGFKAIRRFRGQTIEIEVKNPQGVCRGVKSLTLNGQPLAGQSAPGGQAWETEKVEVNMG